MTDTIITSATQNVAITNLVTLNNDTPVTTSLKIAEVFGKRHDNVVRAIENAIKTINELNFEDSRQMASNQAALNFEDSRQIASEQTEPKIGPSYFDTTTMFQKSTYIGRDGAEAKMYYLNRDAFVFTVIGFTGKEAAAWKLRYIQEFNRMETYIRSQQEQIKPIPTQAQVSLEIAKAVVEQEQRILLLEAEQNSLKRSVQLNLNTCQEAVTIVANYVQNLSTTVQELSARLDNTPDEYLPINKAAANSLNKSVKRLAYMYNEQVGTSLPSAVYNIQEGIRILLTGRYKIDIDEELDKLQAWLRFDYNRRVKSKTKTQDTLTLSEINRLSIYAPISTRHAWTHAVQAHVDFKIQHFQDLIRLKQE